MSGDTAADNLAYGAEFNQYLLKLINIYATYRPAKMGDADVIKMMRNMRILKQQNQELALVYAKPHFDALAEIIQARDESQCQEYIATLIDDNGDPDQFSKILTNIFNVIDLMSEDDKSIMYDILANMADLCSKFICE
jgi:hypothetical protein